MRIYRISQTNPQREILERKGVDDWLIHRLEKWLKLFYPEHQMDKMANAKAAMLNWMVQAEQSALNSALSMGWAKVLEESDYRENI